MLSAFQLENNRLTRLEVEESQPLVNAVWIDLVEPDDDERLRVQSELGQSPQPARNWKTSKHRHVSLKTMTACIFTPSSSLKMRKITPVTPLWHLPSVMVVCLLCVSVNCLHSVCIVCAPVASQWWTVTPTSCCWICSKPKSNSWQMKLKISTAIWSS